jgi:hypothetical protein
MFFRLLSRFFFFSGFALLALSGWLWWDYEQEQFQPYVEQDQQPFQDAELHVKKEITFRLHNPRREAIRLVGMEFS